MRTPSYHQLLPSKEYGGAAEVAFRLMDYLQGKDSGRTCLWLPGPGRAWQLGSAKGYDLQAYDQPDIVHDSRPALLLANLRTGMKLRQFRPGIVHLHSTELYGGLPWASAISSLQRIVHIHLEQEEATVRWAFRRLPELVITCAEYLVENLRRYLSPRQQDLLPIVAVPNCVDTGRFFPGNPQAAKAAVGASPTVPLALMLANLAPHKGQHTALRAVALLKQQNTLVHLWLAGIDRAGIGAYETELRQLIAELQIEDRVKLLGFREDTPELLRAADLFLLPSTREGLPLSVLEAQATQVPVLAAPTPGAAEVIRDAETGFLIAAEDAAGYALRMAELLQHPLLRSTIVTQAAQQVQDKYHEQAYCEKIWALYQSVLNHTSQRQLQGMAAS